MAPTKPLSLLPQRMLLYGPTQQHHAHHQRHRKNSRLGLPASSRHFLMKVMAQRSYVERILMLFFSSIFPSRASFRNLQQDTQRYVYKLGDGNGSKEGINRVSPQQAERALAPRRTSKPAHSLRISVYTTARRTNSTNAKLGNANIRQGNSLKTEMQNLEKTGW